jgi:acyl CoA:acetate/3-ketoacid CoA transferase beta subunit
MEHKNASGKSNIMKECTAPLTGQGCVSKLITDMAVFEFREEGMVLTEIAPDVSIDDVKKATDAKFTVEKDFKKMNLA